MDDLSCSGRCAWYAAVISVWQMDDLSCSERCDMQQFGSEWQLDDVCSGRCEMKQFGSV